MKSAPFCIVLLMVSLLYGCTHPHPIDSVYPWPSSGVSEADSLILAYSRAIEQLDYEQLSEPFANKLCSIAARHPDNKILRLRSGYCRADGLLQSGSSRVLELIDSVMADSDSFDSPYDWHMLQSLRVRYLDNLPESFDLIASNIDFFKRCRAEVELAYNYNRMGHLVFEFSDYTMANRYYDLADSLFIKHKVLRGRVMISNNRTLIEDNEGKDSLFSWLLKATEGCKKERVSVLHNMFLHTDSLKYLQEGIDICKKRWKCQDGNLPILLALKGNYMRRHGNAPGGVRVLEEAFDSLPHHPVSPRLLIGMHEMIGSAYAALGRPDSCASHFSMALNLFNQEWDTHRMSNIYSAMAQKQIKQVEQLQAYRQTKMVLWIVIVALIIVSAASTVLAIAKRKIQQRKFQELLLNEKLEGSKRTIHVQTLIMQESRNLSEHLMEELTHLKEAGQISEEGFHGISNMLKVHKSDDPNRESLTRINDSLSYRFIENLKRDFPDLSEGELRLASYVAAGMDNYYISRLLNIERSSVHKKRYRLRSKLGLSTADSLEDFLRHYNHDSSGR